MESTTIILIVIGITAILVIIELIRTVFMALSEDEAEDESPLVEEQQVEQQRRVTSKPPSVPEPPKMRPGIPIAQTVSRRAVQDNEGLSKKSPKPPPVPTASQPSALTSGRYTHVDSKRHKGSESHPRRDVIDLAKLEKVTVRSASPKVPATTSNPKGRQAASTDSVIAVAPTGDAKKVAPARSITPQTDQGVGLDLDDIVELELEFSDGDRPDSDTRAVVPPGSTEIAGSVDLSNKPRPRSDTIPGLRIDAAGISRAENSPAIFLPAEDTHSPTRDTPHEELDDVFDGVDLDDTIIRARRMHVAGDQLPKPPVPEDQSQEEDHKNRTMMGMRAVTVQEDEESPRIPGTQKKKFRTDGWDF